LNVAGLMTENYLMIFWTVILLKWEN